MGDRHLRDELMTLLVAGHETTATALAWAFERLVRHPAAYDRVQAEAASADGDAYLDAVVKETLRVRAGRPLRRPPASRSRSSWPAGAGRRACGSRPACTSSTAAPTCIPTPTPSAPSASSTTPPGTYTWIPFGGGTRRCLGAAFALYEARVVLRVVGASGRLVADRPQDEANRPARHRPRARPRDPHALAPRAGRLGSWLDPRPTTGPGGRSMTGGAGRRRRSRLHWPASARWRRTRRRRRGPCVAASRARPAPRARPAVRAGHGRAAAREPGAWRAAPILVSGATAYRRGEFLYQDFLYDDRGARATRDPGDPRGGHVFSPAAGTYTYPTDPALCEQRRRPRRAARQATARGDRLPPDPEHPAAIRRALVPRSRWAARPRRGPSPTAPMRRRRPSGSSRGTGPQPICAPPAAAARSTPAPPSASTGAVARSS